VAQTTIVADKDAHYWRIPTAAEHSTGNGPEVQHNVTYGGGAKLSHVRAIANFDVSALAGAQILNAKMVRNISAVVGGGTGGTVARCTRPSQWVETAVDWQHFDHAAGVPGEWTSDGGDIDQATPPQIDYTEPTTTGEHEIFGLGAFVEDALANRSGIVSVIMRLEDEDPGTSQLFEWRSSEYSVAAERWRLVIEYVPAGGGAAEPLDLRDEGRGTREHMSGRRAARPRPATRSQSARPPARPRRPANRA
jgi:hypothetical protein